MRGHIHFGSIIEVKDEWTPLPLSLPAKSEAILLDFGNGWTIPYRGDIASYQSILNYCSVHLVCPCHIDCERCGRQVPPPRRRRPLRPLRSLFIALSVRRGPRDRGSVGPRQSGESPLLSPLMRHHGSEYHHRHPELPLCADSSPSEES